MTEDEWKVSVDPTPMLAFLTICRKASDRKLRLFASSCCRRLHDLFTEFTHDDVRRLVQEVESYLEGGATKAEMREANELAMWAGDDASYHSMKEATIAWAIAGAAEKNGSVAAASIVYERRHLFAEDNEREAFEGRAHCRLIRDIFGNPFRPRPPLLPLLLTPQVLALAESAYRDRIMPQGTLEPEKLLALAAALRNAGCEDEVLLGHLREPGAVHVRGCWVVDLLLFKE